MRQPVDIYVMGKTGTGKSTLINAIVGSEVAPTGIGMAVTKENKCYPIDFSLENRDYTLNLYDTVGLEINEAITEKTIAELKSKIEENQNENHHTLAAVWFCVSQGSKRLEDYEINLIREISFAREIPFVIVMTQCFAESETELEQCIQEALPEVTVCQVMAKPYPLRGGMIPPFGVSALLAVSVLHNSELRCDMLASKLDMLRKSMKESGRLGKERLDRLEAEINSCIEKYASSAEKIGWIPGGCIPFVHAKCVSMIHEINRLAEIPLADGKSEFFTSSLIGALSTPLMLVPILSAGVAKSYLETCGETYRDALLSVLRSSTEQELENMEIIVERIEREIKRS